MSSQTASPETPQPSPAFECLGHCELARYCDGGGMEMVCRYSPVLRLYFAHIPLVLPSYKYANFSRTSVSPPSPGLVLTVLLWPLFGRWPSPGCCCQPPQGSGRPPRTRSDPMPSTHLLTARIAHGRTACCPPPGSCMGWWRRRRSMRPVGSNWWSFGACPLPSN